jgi:hypothetical protein
MKNMNFDLEHLAIAFAHANLMDALSKDENLSKEDQIELFYDLIQTFVSESKDKNYI